MDRWATFDCYGTLVDWNAGLAATLGSPALLERYHEVEPVVQAGSPGLSYREVLRKTARRLGVDADPAEALPGWPVFPDVPPELETARSRGWRLAVLSNSDRDLIEASIASIGVQFDLAIVASEIGSYKPAHRHWEAFATRPGACRTSMSRRATSTTSCRQLRSGSPTVWINRLGERAEPAPTRELPGLTGLADTLEELVP